MQGAIEWDDGCDPGAAGRAAALVREFCPRRPLRVLTHCAVGRLTGGGWGTVLGALRELAAGGDIDLVLATETHPLLPDARRIAEELAEAGIPHTLCIDSAAAAAISRGLVDCVLVGADRIAANGDTANRIGTYALAVAAARSDIPVIVVAPESAIDATVPDGQGIVIDDCPTEGTPEFAGAPAAAPGTGVFHPAFDITPRELITAIATEQRTIRPAAPTPQHIRLIADFPEPGVRFQDLAPVYADPAVLSELVRRLASAFRGRCDHVLAVEARGFPIGALLAQRLGCRLVLARKPGKLPGEVRTVRYSLEYGANVLEVQVGGIPAGGRVLIVDDVLATGGTLAAAAQLVAAEGAQTVGLGVLSEVPGLGGREHMSGYELVVAMTAARVSQ